MELVNTDKPTFIIIGAQKSGSTWLSEALKTNKDVFVVSNEVHFFNKDENYLKGLAWYRSLFTGAINEKVIGEKTPDYFQLPSEGINIAKRIKNDLGEIKLIVILREPKERALSAIKHQIRMGRIAPSLSLNEIIQKRDDIIKKYKIYDYSKYDEILEYYKTVFSEASIKVLFYEHIKNNPDFVLKELSKFLNIKNQFSVTSEDKINTFNKSKVYLYLNYYFPFFKRFASKINGFFKPYTPSLDDKSKKILNEEFKSTIEYFKTYYNPPKEWK